MILEYNVVILVWACLNNDRMIKDQIAPIRPYVLILE